jgi:hypothetical protein
MYEFRKEQGKTAYGFWSPSKPNPQPKADAARKIAALIEEHMSEYGLSEGEKKHARQELRQARRPPYSTSRQAFIAFSYLGSPGLIPKSFFESFAEHNLVVNLHQLFKFRHQISFALTNVPFAVLGFRKSTMPIIGTRGSEGPFKYLICSRPLCSQPRRARQSPLPDLPRAPPGIAVGISLASPRSPRPSPRINRRDGT